MVHTIVTRTLSQEHLRSISFANPPQQRRRSISDSNLLNSRLFSDTKLIKDGNPQERFRSSTSTTSMPKNRSNIPKITISESDLHRLTILFDKASTATKTVKNRKAHCLGIKEEEEDEAHCLGIKEEEEDEAHCLGIREEEEDEAHCLGIREEEEGDGADDVFEEEPKVNKENIRKSEKNKTNIHKPLQQEQQTQTQRKRKNGFSSFSLAKFMTGIIRTRTQTYEPNDPRQLILAIRNRDINRVRYLLDNCPVDVNGCNSKGVTPLQEAALDGQFNIIELLLQYNAEVNQTDDDGLTCLDYAVFGGHFECASFLIGKGVTASSVRDGMPIFN